MIAMVVELGLLAGAQSSLHEFKAGEIIFKQGDVGRELFIVKAERLSFASVIMSWTRFRVKTFSASWR
jgi:hypothetical protein